MNAAVTIMQTTDWKKYSLEEWLYQFGAWMYSNSGTCGKSINPIAVAMDEAVKKQKVKKIQSKEQIVADWINSDEASPKVVKNKSVCEITDNEARAVQRLILDMQNQSDVLDGWLDALVYRYFYGNSWSQMVRYQNKKNEDGVIERVKVYSEWDARFDVKCGLAAMHVRYPFINFSPSNKT